jgi:hypothetical protein
VSKTNVDRKPGRAAGALMRGDRLVGVLVVVEVPRVPGRRPGLRAVAAAAAAVVLLLLLHATPGRVVGVLAKQRKEKVTPRPQTKFRRQQGCQMVYFHTKIPIMVHFGIFWKFHDNLVFILVFVIFVAIMYTFVTIFILW